MTAPPPRPDPVEVALPRPTAAWLVAVLGVIVERGHDIVEDGSGLRARGHAAAVLDWLGRMDDLTADRDRLAKALEDTAAERDRAHADLRLDARDRRIAELEAGLRRIVHSVPLEPHPSAEPKFRTIQRIARDLLNRERS
jgi:hypothetical protein